MDFPNNCRTNILKIAADANPASTPDATNNAPRTPSSVLSPNPPVESPRSSDLHHVECMLRAEGALATTVPETREMWVFHHGGDANALGAWSVASTESGRRRVRIGDISLDESRSSVFNSSSLETKVPLSTTKKSPAPMSAPPASSTFDQGARATQLLNAKAAQVNRSMSSFPAFSSTSTSELSSMSDQDEEDKGDRVYRLFTTALVSLLSYNLSRYHGLIPFNFRTLLSSPEHSVDPGHGSLGGEHAGERPLSITTLHAKLTTSGTLLVSGTFSRLPGLRCLSISPATTGYRTKEVSGDLWLAPGGIVARRLDSLLPVDPGSGGGDQHKLGVSETNRANAHKDVGLRSSHGTASWKEAVCGWLWQKGIELQDLQEDNSWSTVQIWYPSLEGSDDGGSKDQRGASAEWSKRTILWPTPLCFQRTIRDLYSEHDAECLATGLESGLTWSQPRDDFASQDPLEFSEDWFAQKHERLEALKVRARAHETAANLSADSKAKVERSSAAAPMNTAIGIGSSTDAHGAHTVYPTPPDGVQSSAPSGVTPHVVLGTTPSNASNGPNSHHASNSLDPTADDNASDVEMDLWNSTNDASNTSPSAKRENAAAVFGMSTDLDGGDVDLFADMDEEIYNEVGVTEADFSFFDEPDSDGVMNGDVKATARPLDDSFFEDQSFKIDQLIQANGDSQLFRDATANPDDSNSAEAAPNDLKEALQGDSSPKKEWGEYAAPNTPLSSPRPDEDPQRDYSSQQVVSPPLSPNLVRQKILPRDPCTDQEYDVDSMSISNGALYPSEGYHKGSIFQPLPFSSTVDMSRAKYGTRGRFWFPAGVEEKPLSVDLVPNIGLPRNETRAAPKRRLVDIGRDDISPASPAQQLDHHVLNDSIEENAMQPLSDSEDSYDGLSENNGPMHAEGGPLANVPLQTLKRKRDADDDGDSMTSSLQRLGFDSCETDQADDCTIQQLEILAPDPFGWSLSEYFETPSSSHEPRKELSDKDHVDVAQIVTEQLVFDRLNTGFKAYEVVRNSEDSARHSGIKGIGKHEEEFRRAVQGVFPRAAPCNLDELVQVHDTPPELSSGATRPLIRPNPNFKRQIGAQTEGSMVSTNSDSRVVRLRTPQLTVKRGESMMQVLPPALRFWETFGLAPYSGAKNITAFCVYPAGHVVESAVEEFLYRVGSAYEGCKLGKHCQKDLSDIKNGHVPVVLKELETSPEFLTQAMTAIEETCTRLGGLLAELEDACENIVIYIINPFISPGAVVDLAGAFLSLFRAYLYDAKGKQREGVSEVVLRIVPMNLVISTNSLVVLSASQSTTLALEMYERCSLTKAQDDNAPSGGPAPAVTLSQSVPKSIDLKLVPEPSQSPLHDSGCFHVAYSCSLDDRWVSVAWTDDLGKCQATVSYCRAKAGSSFYRPFAHIAKEIWETTISLAQTMKIGWRLMIVKSGVMGSDERDVWTSLSALPSTGLRGLVLLTAEASSAGPLQLLRGQIAVPTLTTQPTLYTTPVSTPTPNIQSPEQVAGAATPNAAPINAPTPSDAAGDFDSDAILVDEADDTWAVVLSHRLSNSNSVIEHSPALASGYLVKKGGSHEDDGPVTVGINLLHAQRSFEPLLREVLQMFADLACLARLKGLVDPDNRPVPWHIAAAIKAQDALTELM
ncbi:MAG: mediator of RNA polymerase II transcription subunit 13 [Piccolia ochrophora]|nr:MAG: mediator of RNA polymerase II transcription subunit 13 [Piccolia ochrophora]